MKLRWLAVTSVVGAAGVAAALWVDQPTTPGADLRTLLVAVMAGRRPVEGRLSGFTAAPFQPGAALAPQDRAALAEASRALAKRLGRVRSAADLADAAQLKIASGRWEQAASLLVEAAARAPQHAALVNDLAVVYLTQAVADRQPQRLVLALATVERASRLAPAQPEPAFNRALILEYLGLKGHARVAWRQYLAADAGSGWAAEATHHLAALKAGAGDSWTRRRMELEEAIRAGQSRRTAAIIRRYSQATRVWLEVKVLYEWARAIQRGNETDAAQARRSAQAMASGLQEVSGDHLVGEAVAAIERASGQARQLLSRGHLDFGNAYALYKQDRFEEAREHFARARAALREAESPFSAWADYYLADCDYRAERIGAAAAAFEDLSRSAIAHSYLNVAGRAEWMLGLIALEQASPDQALDHLRPALQLFERTHESGNQGAVASLMANALDYAGERGEAWRYRYRAIQATQAAGDDDRLPAILGAVARALLKQHEVSAALAFQDELLGLIQVTRDPLNLAEAFWWRAMIQHEGGHEAQAIADIAQARSWGAGIAHQPSRLRTLAGISVTEGAVLRSSRPRLSVVALSRALADYRQLRYSYLLVDIYWERALSLLALGEFDAAEADLEAGIEEFERQRARLHDLQLQASYFERAQRVVEAMISFQLDRRHDPERAFDFAERSKARTLLDLTARAAAERPEPATRGNGGVAPVTAAVVRGKLPAGALLVQYSVLPDRIAIWSHWRGGGAFQEVRFERQALEALVGRLVTAAQDAASVADMAAPSERLFGLLIEPVLAHLPEQATLVIVPDKALAALPFHALREARRGRFLIERNPLTTAPSASTFLRSLAAADRQVRRGHLAVLAVGNPAFDRSIHGRLSLLPYAEDEARQVVAWNRDSLALIGKEATASRFVSLLNRYDLVHYSGHAIQEGGSPLDASLVFAPGAAGSAEDLSAAEIQQLRLARPRLIVLAACGGASGLRRDLEGVSHLASAFLAAGAPSVLANLWNVDDRSALAFFGLFYRELENGKDPLGALQATQILMIRNPEPELRRPSAWAGFQLLGAASSQETTTKGEPHV